MCLAPQIVQPSNRARGLHLALGLVTSPSSTHTVKRFVGEHGSCVSVRAEGLVSLFYHPFLSFVVSKLHEKKFFKVAVNSCSIICELSMHVSQNDRLRKKKIVTSSVRVTDDRSVQTQQASYRLRSHG